MPALPFWLCKYKIQRIENRIEGYFYIAIMHCI